VTKVAVPEDNVAVPIEVPVSVKVTVPVGVPTADAMTTENVTLWPYVEVASDEVKVVVVGAWLTSRVEVLLLELER
jgi:hypothetical protein